jgi:hypothetical protein
LIATDTGEELHPVRVGSGVLDEICALRGVLPLIPVVNRVGEGTTGFGEVPTDIRDPSEFTYEGCIGSVADVGNVFDVGIGGYPKVAEDNRENNL